MPRRTLLLLLALLSLATAAGGRVARADRVGFSAGTLIIPMDACYQAAPDQPRPAGCLHGKATADDGAIKAYGLVYQLLRKGVTVFAAADPAKGAPDAPDFTVDGSGAVPVQRLVRPGDSLAGFTPDTLITYRGAPFLVDASQAAQARALLAADPALAPFVSPEVHVAAVSFSAPVTQLRGAPPRLALIDPCSGAPGCPQGGDAGSEGIPLMQAYLRRAGLDQPGDIGRLGSPGGVADLVTLDDIVNRNALQIGRYQIVWLPHYRAPTWNGTAYQVLPADLTALLRLTSFVGAGGVLLAGCAAVFSLEGGNDPAGTLYAPPDGVGNFAFTTRAGAVFNQVGGCYPGNRNGFRAGCSSPVAPLQPPTGQGLRYAEPANLLSQIGDFSFFDFLPAGRNAEGTVGNWDLRVGSDDFRPEVAHLVSSADAVPANNDIDLFSLVRQARGQVLYLGGHSYADPAQLSTAGLRLVLNSLFFSAPLVDLREEARSGPIVAVDGRIYQGSYRESAAPRSVYTTAADAPQWLFPQVEGHLRQYSPSSLPPGTVTELGSPGEDWDAALRMPEAAGRTVYTQQGSGSGAALVEFGVANREAFRADLLLPLGNTDPDADGLIQAVRQGRLGGIDHSTLALVPPSGVTPAGQARPTVAYVGALDGQLHAIAVSGAAVTPGAELWSFLPRDQLGRLRQNQAGVDASPNVRDLFDDWNGTGLRGWRTVLGIPEGSYGTSAHALDVTDPANPRLLWQRGTADSGVVLGQARGATWSMVTRSAAPAGVVSELVVATNLPGGQGFQVSALSGRDGTLLWSFGRSYTRTAPGSASLVPNDMPGAPAVADVTGRGTEDRVYVADYEGRLWELDAVTGQSLTGDTPLFDVGPTPQGNLQPIGASPAIYRDLATRHVIVLLATGGADWAAPNDSYGLYAVDVEQFDGRTGRRGALAYSAAVGGGRIYALTVFGNDAYVVASSGSLDGSILGSRNDAGMLSRINLSTRKTTLTQAVSKSAGALYVDSGGTIVGATVKDQLALGNAGNDSRDTSLRSAQKLLFRAWLEWL